MMGIYDTCEYMLYVFSDAMLYPDMIGLILLFGWSLTLVGSMVHDFTTRNRDLEKIEEICFQAAGLVRSGRTDQAAAKLGSYGSKTLVSRVLKEMGDAILVGTFHLKFEKILQDAEISIDKSLELIRIGVRIGPMLG
jgi:biopolymer transport protein ExbB/TolQ